MRLVIAFASMLLGVAALAHAQSGPDAYRTYKAEMARHGMAALIPATSDFGPGYVYRWVRTQGSRQTTRTVCENAFLTEPREITTRLPNTHRFTENAFSASLDVAPGALADNLKAALGGEAGRVRTVDMKFGELKDFEVAEANAFDAQTETVVERRINPACALTLRSLPLRDGKFRDKVFLVLRATAPTSFEYTLAGEANAGIKIAADVESVATGRAGWRMKRVNDQSFQIVRDPAVPEAERLHIAAQIVQLTNAEEITQVSGPVRGRMAIKPPTPQDLANLSQPKRER